MKREHWKSKIGFIWAAVGSAIGLGSIWRFPYVVGENGGAVFVLFFLFFLLLISLPVLISEVTIGRKTQLNPAGAYKTLGKAPFWTGIGKMTLVTALLVSAFYSVIAGWTLGYLIEACFGHLIHFTSGAQTADYFEMLTRGAKWSLLCQAGFLALSLFILYVGVQKGIEKWNEILMPLLFAILLFLVLRGLTLSGAREALHFLFSPDWSAVNAKLILLALGQAFFGFSLGQGTMITYGSYLSKKDNIPGSAFPIAISVLIISLLAGVAIFTVVFSSNVAPGSGPNLMFQSLPLVFSQITGGYLLSILFFLLIFVAALTSQISAMEPLIAYLMDRSHLSRHQASTAVAITAFLIGAPIALSYGVLKEWTLFGANLFDAVTFLTVNILIPLGGLGSVLLFGWKWGLKDAIAHLKEGTNRFFDEYPIFPTYLSFSIKYFVPVIILIILLNAVGII